MMRILTLVAGSAAVAAQANDRPTVSDAVAEYEAFGRSECEAEMMEFDAVNPGVWARFRESPQNGDWNRAWPLNQIEKQAGAFGIVISLQNQTFVETLTYLQDVLSRPDETLTQGVAKMNAEAALAQCLLPTEQEVLQIPDEKSRKQFVTAIKTLECNDWFVAQRRLFEDVTDNDIPQVVAQQVLDETIGLCSEVF